VNTAVSPDSCTPWWLRSAASEGVLDGTHILSANPQYDKVEADIDYDSIERFWETHWNTDLQTTLPEPILERITEVVTGNKKRVVAHLQQPHWPYVAKLGGEWLLADDELGSWTSELGETTSLQVAMQRGLIDIDKAKQAYRASVESVWQAVLKYIPQLVSDDHTVIITADHGETFGRLQDFGFYEHPCGCNIPPLVRVPWVEFSPSEPSQTMNTVEDRLQALGYAE
jgi:hypothetical protein